MPRKAPAKTKPKGPRKKGTVKATGRDYSKQKEYNAKPAQKKYRAELTKEARKRGVEGKRTAMKKDLSHQKDGSIKLESRKKNRARPRLEQKKKSRAKK
jgi:hypothetical protein